MRRLSAILGALLGLSLFLLLLARNRPGDVLAVLAGSGWAMAWIAPYRFVAHVVDSVGWRQLLPEASRPGMPWLVLSRWVGESANTLLPLAQVGGHLVRARMLALGGCSLAVAGAATIVDVTLGVGTQLAFSLLGAGLLARSAPVAGWRMLALLLGGAAVLTAFVVSQRSGVLALAGGLLERLVKGRRLAALVGGARDMDQRLQIIYARRATVLLAGATRMLGWLSRCGETWLAMRLLGHPVTLGQAVILETLSQAAGNAAFLVPGALGVRDGTLLLLGGLLGVPAEFCLALAVLKRGRELLLGLPGLLVYLWAERRAGFWGGASLPRENA